MVGRPRPYDLGALPCLFIPLLVDRYYDDCFLGEDIGRGAGTDPLSWKRARRGSRVVLDTDLEYSSPY